VLYRSSVEEESDEKRFDVYSIPDYGKLVIVVHKDKYLF
jgi:hypothetical protein